MDRSRSVAILSEVEQAVNQEAPVCCKKDQALPQAFFGFPSRHMSLGMAVGAFPAVFASSVTAQRPTTSLFQWRTDRDCLERLQATAYFPSWGRRISPKLDCSPAPAPPRSPSPATKRTVDRRPGLRWPGLRQHHMEEQHPEKLRARYALDQHRASVVADAEGDQAIAITEDLSQEEHHGKDRDPDQPVLSGHCLPICSPPPNPWQSLPSPASRRCPSLVAIWPERPWPDWRRGRDSPAFSIDRKSDSGLEE
jgi:hypothetical protein